jgi:hypothetical protein
MVGIIFMGQKYCVKNNSYTSGPTLSKSSNLTVKDTKMLLILNILLNQYNNLHNEYKNNIGKKDCKY